jgi:hypothetical protein
MPMVHARDLRSNIKTYGYEHGTVITLELLLDEFAAYRQYLQRLADIQNDLIDQMTQLTIVGGDLMERIKAMRRSEEQYEQVKSEGIVPNGDDS